VCGNTLDECTCADDLQPPALDEFTPPPPASPPGFRLPRLKTFTKFFTFGGSTVTKGKFYRYVSGPASLMSALNEDMIPVEYWFQDAIQYATSLNIGDSLWSDLLSIIPVWGAVKLAYKAVDAFFGFNYEFHEAYDTVSKWMADTQESIDTHFDVFETIISEGWTASGLGGHQDESREYFDPDAGRDLFNYVWDIAEAVWQHIGGWWDEHIAEPIHDYIDWWNAQFGHQNTLWYVEHWDEVHPRLPYYQSPDDIISGGSIDPEGGKGLTTIQPIVPDNPISDFPLTASIISWFIR
jgi:hypothetical protein